MLQGQPCRPPFAHASDPFRSPFLHSLRCYPSAQSERLFAHTRVRREEINE